MKDCTTSREDYLKAILVLQNKIGDVHSVDVARYLGLSKPSVSQAISKLVSEDDVFVGNKHILHLTEQGRAIAEEIYARHRFFTDFLIAVGVDSETAMEDACHMEHAISEESFQKLKDAVQAAQ